MDINRLNKCNDILSKLSSLKSTREEIEKDLKLSINNRYLDDPMALDEAKKVILALYDIRIRDMEIKFQEA
jgi:hypothetical protein